ncbi:hypothetical protein LINPERHAP1_LOCUS6849 [Linum perenne]
MGHNSWSGNMGLQQAWGNQYNLQMSPGQRGNFGERDQIPWERQWIGSDNIRNSVENIAVNLAMVAPYNLQFFSTPNLVSFLLGLEIPYVTEALRHCGSLNQEGAGGSEPYSCNQVERLQREEQMMPAEINDLSNQNRENEIGNMRPTKRQRGEGERVWEEISGFKRPPEVPWCLIGDFNAIRSREEKEGGNPTPVRRLQQFNGFIADIGVMDMRFSGDIFTWCNNNRQGNVIKQRLDRGMCNGGWCEIFPRSFIVNEVRIQSDHSPIVMLTEDDGERYGRRRFYYEQRWQNLEGYDDIVNGTWVPGVDTKENLKECAAKFRRWKHETFGGGKQRIERLKEEINSLTTRVISEEVLRMIDMKQEELARLWKADEDYWASRAGVQWARFGDRNTRFFHLSTIQRRGWLAVSMVVGEGRERGDVGKVVRGRESKAASPPSPTYASSTSTSSGFFFF